MKDSTALICLSLFAGLIGLCADTSLTAAYAYFVGIMCMLCSFVCGSNEKTAKKIIEGRKH